MANLDKPSAEDLRVYILDQGVDEQHVEAVVKAALDSEDPWGFIDEHITPAAGDANDVTVDPTPSPAEPAPSSPATVPATSPAVPGLPPATPPATEKKPRRKRSNRKSKAKPAAAASSAGTGEAPDQAAAAASSPDGRTAADVTAENRRAKIEFESNAAFLTAEQIQNAEVARNGQMAAFRNRPARARKRPDVVAADLVVGADCPFEVGCFGTIEVYSSHRVQRNNAEGQPETVTIQNLRCTDCRSLPANPKIVESLSTARRKRREQRLER